MTPIKEFGECVVSTDKADYFFRPSFLAMARIGEPKEIVQAFYDLCNDQVTPVIQRAVASYGEQIPAYVMHYIHGGLLTRPAIMAAHTVLTACCGDDIAELIGWIKPGRSHKRSMVWRLGIMPAQDMIIIAQNLMAHGVVGKAKVRKLQRHEQGSMTSEFHASEYINAARHHFSMSREEAERLTMTEFLLLLNSKYPQQQGFTREEYDAVVDDYFAMKQRRLDS